MDPFTKSKCPTCPFGLIDPYESFQPEISATWLIFLLSLSDAPLHQRRGTGGEWEDLSLQLSKEVPGAIGSSAEAVRVRSLDLTSTTEAYIWGALPTVSWPQCHVCCRVTSPTHPKSQEYCRRATLACCTLEGGGARAFRRCL